MTPNTRTATLLAVMIAAAMISGCLHAEEETPAPAIEIPTPPRDIPEPIEAPKTIDLLIADITQNNIANKSEYAIYPQYGSDVYVCIHMACIQSEYLIEEGYEAGIVLLWCKCLGDHHAQSWVRIDNETFIIESTSDIYWRDWAHKTVFDRDYKIQFVSIKKGYEYAKASSEMFHT